MAEPLKVTDTELLDWDVNLRLFSMQSKVVKQRYVTIDTGVKSSLIC